MGELELATVDDLDQYRCVNNPPAEPLEPVWWPGSTYNTVVGRRAEEETWQRYPPNRLPNTWQQPYDGVIATKNGKELGFAEDMRQVQVKTRTWHKKSGGNNYYNITLASHQQMQPDSFYHFWIHTTTEEPDTEHKKTQQLSLTGHTLEADQRNDIGGALTFYGDAVFTWDEIEALISYAHNSYNQDETMTGIGFSTDSHDNPRIDIAVPLMFDYKEALLTAEQAYETTVEAQTSALQHIDDTQTDEHEAEDDARSVTAAAYPAADD